ncbi:MAG: class I SAM-dependent methyltransferase [Chloroflexota bacterium]|nr:class I SAM-dependent methyltransferase [Chloroflexota bacterium]
MKASRAKRPDSGYDLLARYYELEYRDYDLDIDFYCQLIRRTGGPFLDLGCGTGRVALAVAAITGCEAVGIDSSEAMLSIGRGKTRKNVQLLAGDMRTFELRRAFPLIAVTLNSFMHLIRMDDQLSALRRVAAHLAAGGSFVISTINPYSVSLQDTESKLIHEFTLPDVQAGSQVTKLSAREVDTAAQVEHVTFFYDELKDGTVSRTVAELDFRYTYRYELRLLLEQAGLTVVREYGSYDLEPYELTSPALIMVADHAPQAGASNPGRGR